MSPFSITLRPSLVSLVLDTRLVQMKLYRQTVYVHLYTSSRYFVLSRHLPSYTPTCMLEPSVVGYL